MDNNQQTEDIAHYSWILYRRVRTIQLDEPGDTGYIRFDHQCYVGQDFAAFVTSKMSDTGRANDRHSLNRIRLETLSPVQEIVSITAAEPHILGVLADGRIVFWYEFNPAEKGICVTSATSASRTG